MFHERISRLVHARSAVEAADQTIKRLVTQPLSLDEASKAGEEIRNMLAAIDQRENDLKRQLSALEREREPIRASQKALELLCPHDNMSDSEGSMTFTRCNICGKVETSDLSSHHAYMRM